MQALDQGIFQDAFRIFARDSGWRNWSMAFWKCELPMKNGFDGLQLPAFLENPTVNTFFEWGSVRSRHRIRYLFEETGKD